MRAATVALDISSERFERLFGARRGGGDRRLVTTRPPAHERLLADFVRGCGPARHLDGFELRVNPDETATPFTPRTALALDGEAVAHRNDDGWVHIRYEPVPGWKRGRLRRMTRELEKVCADEGARTVPQVWGVLDSHFRALPPA